MSITSPSSVFSCSEKDEQRDEGYDDDETAEKASVKEGPAAQRVKADI